MSDDMWSRPRLVLTREQVPIVARASLTPIEHKLSDTTKTNFQDFFTKFELPLGSHLLGESEKTGQEFRLDVLWRILICAFIVCEASDRCDISRGQTLASSYQLKGCLRALKMPTMARLLYL